MFDGFTEAHFDAYAAAKWRSMAYNLERRAAKDALAALGRALAPQMTAASGAPLACEASDEFPSLGNHKRVQTQDLYFVRAADERRELDRIMDRARGIAAVLQAPTPQRSHANLAVSLAFDHVFCGFALHRDASIDRRNFEAQMADPWRAEAIAAQLSALPSSLAIVVGARAATPAEASVEVVGELLAALAAQDPGAARLFAVGRRLPRADAIAMGAGVAELIGEILAAALPIYHAIAWAPDRDSIGLRETLREARVVKTQRGLAKNDEVRIVNGVFAGRTGVVQDVDKSGGVKVLVGNVPLRLRARDLDKR